MHPVLSLNYSCIVAEEVKEKKKKKKDKGDKSGSESETEGEAKSEWSEKHSLAPTESKSKM